MKKLMTTLMAGTFSLAAFSAMAADALTLQLKWVTQAQFAGYYVAKDKGFYEEENLDVEIKPGGPDVAPPQVIAGGGADVVLDWMPSALATREKGVVNGILIKAGHRTGIQDQGTPRDDEICTLQGRIAECSLFDECIISDKPAFGIRMRE